MGGAQPLAATMNGAAILGVDVDEARIDKRLETGYCDRKTHDLDEALALDSTRRPARSAALSVGLVGNAAEVLPGARRARRHARRRDRPDERARHAQRLRARRAVARGRGRAAPRAIPTEYVARANASIVRARARDARDAAARRRHVRLRQQHSHRRARQRRDERVRHSRASCPSTSGRCSAKGRGRSAGSRSPAIRRDLARTDELVLELFPHDAHLRRWITLARERVHFQGLPARICWLGQGERATLRRRAQRSRRKRRDSRRRSSSGAIISTRAASRRRSARPKR